mgnify:CR=1 FL=1
MIRNTTKRQKLGWVLLSCICAFWLIYVFFREFRAHGHQQGYQYNLVPFKEFQILPILQYHRTPAFSCQYDPRRSEVKKAAVHAPAGKFRKFSRFFFHRFAPAAIMLVIVIGGFVYGSSSGNMSGEKVIVYNWGDYIDPEIITMFEDETGIDVVYEEYEQ